MERLGETVCKAMDAEGHRCMLHISHSDKRLKQFSRHKCRCNRIW